MERFFLKFEVRSSKFEETARSDGATKALFQSRDSERAVVFQIRDSHGAVFRLPANRTLALVALFLRCRTRRLNDTILMPWDDDIPDEEWVDDEDDASDQLLVCPSCKRDVHEDTQQCPHCGDWITPEYASGAVKRWIYAVVVLLLVLVFSGLMLL